MILRGAIFTAERRHLGAQSVPGVTASPAVGPAVDTPHVSGEELAATYEVPAPEAPPLSSDRVASWLVTQDGATRTAVASLLSDELTALRDAAREEGYSRGHAEAMEEAREKVGGALEALNELHVQAEAAFVRELGLMQEACAEVVAAAFFKLAGSALVTPEAVTGVVAEVLKRVREERELSIHVNPRDLPLLKTAEAGIAASLPGRQFTLVADGRVETGGCIVESTLGSLDGRLEVQLAGLLDTLRAAREPGVRA